MGAARGVVPSARHAGILQGTQFSSPSARMRNVGGPSRWVCRRATPPPRSPPVRPGGSGLWGPCPSAVPQGPPSTDVACRIARAADLHAPMHRPASPRGGGGVVGPRWGVLQVSLGAFARAVARFLHTVHDHLRAYAFDSYLLIPLIFHCVLALSLSPRSFISRRRSLEEKCGLFRSVFSDRPTSSVLG